MKQQMLYWKSLKKTFHPEMIIKTDSLSNLKNKKSWGIGLNCLIVF